MAQNRTYYASASARLKDELLRKVRYYPIAKMFQYGYLKTLQERYEQTKWPHLLEKIEKLERELGIKTPPASFRIVLDLTQKRSFEK